ncbi:MAG: 30S ribosomal protein S16 [Dehalococcoidia bacterium]|nr:30S ribosomal protein S16 [Dehalococcoidia bacterium]MDZ4246995.1 30S ribosomal protein S16 [Dehalococcoidia bacterium]
MVKIRLRRTGAKKRPNYRVVVADERAPRDGAFIEIIGYYNPLTDPPTIVIEKDRAIAWLGKGAKPTETMARLLSKVGILQEFKSGVPEKESSVKAEVESVEIQESPPETEEKE